MQKVFKGRPSWKNSSSYGIFKAKIKNSLRISRRHELVQNPSVLERPNTSRTSENNGI